MFTFLFLAFIHFASAETVSGKEDAAFADLTNPSPLVQPLWDRKPMGVTVDQIISAPAIPKKNDELAKSVVSIGYVIHDNSFLPAEMRHLAPMDEYSHACSGAAVGKTRILTAAHCNGIWTQFDKITKMLKLNVDLSKKISMFVVPTTKPDSKSHLSKDAIKFSISDFKMNSKYSNKLGDRENDLAMILLNKPINATIAKIIPSGQIVPDSTKIRIYGYSWMENGEDLKYTEAILPKNYDKSFPDLEDQETMKDYFVRMQKGTATGEFDRNEKAFVYPVSRHRHSCPGTSGGPVFAEVNGQFYIAGVTSGGEFLDEQCDSKKDKIDPSVVGSMEHG